MKIFCEYCGTRIDTEANDTCPKCGASYRKNATFIRLEEERKQEENKNKEYKDAIISTVVKRTKTAGHFMIIPIILFIVIFCLVLTFIVRNIINMNKDSKPTNGNIEQNEIIDKMITVNINEYGSTKDYKAKVTGYNKSEDVFNKLNSDYEYITFNLVVENLTSEEQKSENVNCIVDGIAQDNSFSSGYSTIPFFISPKLTVKGDATFAVPKNATEYDIRYGDYITIHIEK